MKRNNTETAKQPIQHTPNSNSVFPPSINPSVNFKPTIPQIVDNSQLMNDIGVNGIIKNSENKINPSSINPLDIDNGNIWKLDPFDTKK